MKRPLVSVAVVLAAALLSSAASAADVLVWTPDGDGYQTRWVTVDGDRVATVATRPEAVASDGTTLWALRVVTKALALHPCADMEAPAGRRGKPEGTFDWPALQAAPLGGGEAHWIIAPPEDAVFYGEVWNEKITLIGSAGPTVMMEHRNSGYACGAHGYVDDALALWSLPAKDWVEPAGLVPGEAKLRKSPVAALVAKAKQEECFEEELSEASIFLDGISLAAKGGAVTADLTYIHPTGAEWQFACTLEQGLRIDAQALSQTLRPVAEVRQVLAALKITGTVGYAPLGLTGEARAKALAAFKAPVAKRAPARTWASAAAKPFIAAGRKATAAKQYDDAIAAFDTALRKDASAARAWSGRGYAKLLAGKRDAAARDFDRALTLDATPEFHAAIWYNLGQIAEQQGHKRKARRAYERSQALKPSKGARAALDRLR